MSRPIQILAVAAGAFLLLASFLVVTTLSGAGQFTTIRPLGGESCRELTGIVGAEDVAIDRRAGTAYVSSTDRAAVNRGEAVRGEIFALDLDKGGDAGEFVATTGGMPADFRPVGISLWTSPTGEQRLFAINRPASGPPRVDVFDVGPDGLSYLKPIEAPLITSPNGIHAVGPEQFYVTNDGGQGAMRMVDFAFQRLPSDVVYYDGKDASVAATGFGYANGIAASPDGSTVYVTDTFTRRLGFFNPNGETGALTETGSLLLGTGLDNIDVAADGTLWIAAHPKLLDFLLYFGGWRERAPSQVIRAVPGASGGGEARTMLLDLGERLSASSVAAALDDRYLVGSLMDTRMLVCRLSTGG